MQSLDDATVRFVEDVDDLSSGGLGDENFPVLVDEAVFGDGEGVPRGFEDLGGV